MPMSDPFSVVVHVPEGLGEAMKQLRLWLDGEKLQATSFTTSIDAKGFTMTVGFASIEDADRFRQRFVPSMAEAGHQNGTPDRPNAD
jgi:hypothetical protein